MRKPILLITAFIIVIGCIASCIGHNNDMEFARDIYNARNAGDSAKFVQLYAIADASIIRKYNTMVEDSIRWENEWKAAQDRAINEWYNKQ